MPNTIARAASNLCLERIFTTFSFDSAVVVESVNPTALSPKPLRSIASLDDPASKIRRVAGSPIFGLESASLA
jgi:hypothetical protein